MDAYAEGDDHAFEAVYDELAPRLYSYVRQIAPARAGSEDLLQQVFLKVHQARSAFVKGTRVEPWIYAIARHVAIDWLRHRREDEGCEQQSEGADDVCDVTPEMTVRTWQLEEALRRALTKIPEKLRDAFLLVRVEGLAVSEAAEVLGATAMAVKLRAHRAGLMLRQELLRLEIDAKAR